nr:DUF2946 family protein [uncultured Rhodoferax sp.]
MDDIVKQAMAKWPNVPDCYGWLGLDGRGDWYLRDDAAQAAGTFSSGVPGAKGSRLQHEKLIEFIQRNYAPDEQGRWYFQNGPQRVYVELQYTPWVWRVGTNGQVTAHSGQAVRPSASFLDEAGHLYLVTSLGIGLVHTADMGPAAAMVEAGSWTPMELSQATLERRFSFVRSPWLQLQRT